MFSDTFAGIAPASAPAFIGAQVIGGVLAVVVVKTLYPGVTPAEAADVVVPHNAGTAPDQTEPTAGRSPARLSD
jgi:arsenate reductase